ncbi:MAG: iron-sulfur cluster repair di-iron protein [Lacunisphaera sp.]
MTNTIETTVGDLVRAAPVRSRIFEKMGIDFCCGGKKPLAEACRAKGLDPVTVLAMLEALGTGSDNAAVDPDQMSLSALCDHIEKAHHGYLREELPRLDFMTRKVAAVHGDGEPRLAHIREAFTTFAPAMIAHMKEEEEEIFPQIRQLELDGTPAKREALRDLLGRLEREHDAAGASLARFRELSDGYAPPEWACNTFRAMYDGLDRLERDMHQHVHKENNVLFPRALAAQAS